MKKIKTMLSNEYIFSLAAKVITIVAGLVQSVLVARYLGSELKGFSSYIQSICSVGSIFVTFGMHQAYPYFRNKYGRDRILQDYVSMIYIVYASYLLIGLCGSAFFYQNITVSACCILIPLFGYSNVISYLVLVESPNRYNRIFMILSILDILFVVLLMIATTANRLYSISIFCFVEVAKCLTYTWALSIRFHYTENIRKLLIECVCFGFFPMIALIMTTLNYKVDVLMLRQFDSISDGMIGVYSIGILIAEKLVLIPDTLKGVLVSKLAKGAKEQEVAKVARLCFWCTCVLVIGFIVLGKPFISILFGAEYHGAYEVTVIACIGALFIGYFKLIAQYNIIQRRQVRNVIMLSVAIVVNVILNLIFIPIYGINGAAAATGIGHFVCGLVFMVWFSQNTGIYIADMIRPPIKEIMHYIRNRNLQTTDK